MTFTDEQEFWWTNITGARTVVDRVAAALQEGKIALLKVPSDLSWRHTMRSSVQASFREHADAGDIIFQEIDAPDDMNDMDPGRFILERFALPNVRTGYRSRSRVSIQEYISSRDVIKNRIIWVKGLDEQSTDKWVTFCRGFDARSASDGLFVLESHGNIRDPYSKAITYIDFNGCVSNYDVQLFNGFLLDEKDKKQEISNTWKRYIATVAAVLCGVDAEVSAALLKQTDLRKEPPIAGIQKIAEDEELQARGAEDGSDHVLWHYRHGNMGELEHRVWTAQIQVLFPMIELERMKLVDKWQAEICEALSRERVLQYGQQLTDPANVDLGALSYIMNRRQDNGQYLLCLEDNEDRQRIEFLHECRNALAHADCCTPEQVAELIDGSEG